MAGEFGFGAALGLGTEDYEAGAKRAATSSDKVTDSAKRMGKASDSAGKRLKGAGDRARDAGGRFKKSGEAAGSAGKRFDGMGRQAANLQRSVRQIFAGFSVALVVNELKKASEAFGRYQQDLRGVGKTANLRGAELAALGRRLEDLTRPGRGGLAIALDVLLENAEAAGQLGVQGAANIEKYAVTIGKLGTASDLAGSQGATALARLQNITGESADTVDALASVIVALGNNFAATESQIAHHAGEVARATAVFEISSAEAAAFGTVLAAFGVRAELAGSATGRAMRTIEDAVKSGGDAMTELERLTGSSAAQIRKAWERGPIEAFQLFLGGVEEIRAGGGNVAEALARIGLKGEEVLKVIPVLAKENQELARALALQAKEVDNATALNEEFSQAVDTQKGELRLLSNEWDAFQRKIGAELSPALLSMAEAAGAVIGKLNEWLTRDDDIARLLDELAPRVEKVEKRFRNLAEEIERAADVQIALDNYKLLVDELARQEEALERARNSTSDLALVQQEQLRPQVERLRAAVIAASENLRELAARERDAGEEGEEGLGQIGDAAEDAKVRVAALSEEFENLLSVENILRNVRDVIDRMFRDPIEVKIEPIVTGEVRIFGDRGSTSVSPGRLSPVSGIASTVEEAIGGAIIRTGDVLEDRFGASFEIVSRVAARDFEDKFRDGISSVGAYLEDNWQDALSHVLGGVLDAVFSGGDIGAALSGGLGDVGGMLGGIFGSQFGPLGSMLGSALGEQAGQIVGDLVGDFLGFGESLEDAYSTVIAEGGQLLVGVQQGSGQVATLVDDMLANVLGIANSIVGSLGGSIDALTGGGLALQVNMEGDEIREIKAYIEGVAHIFQTVDEAVNALVGHVLSLSATSGLDPEVEAILREAAGKPLAQINAEVAAAVRVAAGRMGADVASFRDQVRAIFADFATVFGAGGDPMAGTLGRLRAMWDVATGQQKSAEEIFEGRKRIILAEIDLEIARLEAEQRALQAEAEQAQVGINLDQARLLAHHEILRGEAHVVQATADFAGQLIAIANMISELELLSGEIATTPFRPPSIPGVARPTGGGAPEIDVEAIEREIALAEARGAGNEALVEALLLEEQMAGLRERGWTQEQIDRLLAAQEAQEALAEEAAELARQEEEAARQAEALQQQIGDLFGQLGSFGDGRSGASGQIQDAIDQMDAMWAALNELRPEDLSPEELAAASEQIQNAIAQTAEEISRVGADLVTGTLAGALRTAISRTDDPRERLRLQEELFELERALGIIKQQAAIAELAQVEALMRSQGLWTAELEAQSNRAIELLSEPWPDFVADITGAGEDFATSVGSAATAAGEAFRALVFPELIPAMSPALTPAQVEALYGPQIGALLARIGATEVDVGAKTPFDLMREEVDRLAHLFPAFGLVVEDVMADIDALEVAELAKRWADAGKGLDSFLDELEFGELSGKSGRVQAQFAQAQVRSLLARAQAGDVDALSELGQAGPDFWRLAAGSVNPVDLARIRQELLSQGRLATSGPFGDAGSGDQGADFSRIADQLGGVKRATEDTTGAVTTSGGEIVDEISGLRADLAQHRADHHAMSTPL